MVLNPKTGKAVYYWSVVESVIAAILSSTAEAGLMDAGLVVKQEVHVRAIQRVGCNVSEDLAHFKRL